MTERLLETSVLIDILRDDVRAFRLLRDNKKDRNLLWYVSAVSVAEVLFGCKGRADVRTVQKKLAPYSVLHVSEPISQVALRWFTSLYFSHGASYLDCLIGATAKHHGMAICTLNRKHFEPMKGLKVIVPY